MFQFSFSKMFPNLLKISVIFQAILLSLPFMECGVSFTGPEEITTASDVGYDTGIDDAQCQCEYYRLEGYYIWHNFTQFESFTHRQIHLNPNGRVQYRCLLSIPKCHNSKLLRISGRSSRIPEIFTRNTPDDGPGAKVHPKPSRGICENLQISIEMPFTSTENGNFIIIFLYEKNKKKI